MKTQSMELSIIIPVYNGGPWLEDTVYRTIAAVSKAKIKNYEVIIVNDGSSDGTLAIAQLLSGNEKLQIKLINQQNEGRFLARRNGMLKARFDRILLVDVRTWIDEDAIVYLASQLQEHPERQVWNSHINVNKKRNIIARFADAITFIGWRRYFKKPRLVSYTTKDFDYFPKGTGLFCAPKSTLISAVEWFEKNTNDIRNSSDDTLLIRHIAEDQKIWLSPKYSGTYFARTKFREFVRHTYQRGQFFVDGFFRKGTRFYYPLMLFLAVSVAIPIAIIIKPGLLVFALSVLIMIWLLEFFVSISLGLGLADAGSLFILSPLFAISYGLGIWRAIIRKVFRHSLAKI